MKKLLYLGVLVFLFVSLTGANSINTPRESTQIQKVTSMPKKVKPPNLLNSTEVNSTNESFELETNKNFPIIPKITESPNPLASGGSGEKGIPIYNKGPHTTLDSFNLTQTGNNGSEWNGRYIYVVKSISHSDSSIVQVFDPEVGLVIDEWKMPFIGACMGMAFINNAMYVVDWTNGYIRKVSMLDNSLLATYTAPGGTYARGLTSDGVNLYVGVAEPDTVYKTDTLTNVIDSWYIGSFCTWVMDLAYAGRDQTIWLINDDTDQIIKVDISGASAVQLEAFTPPGNPASNIGEGVSFDGSDLWFNTYYLDKIYRLDGEYSHSRIALFQEHEPWGYRSIKDILYDSGIPFKIFGMDDMGSVDLSIYTKAIVASSQDREMFDSLETYKTWWENWVSNGGVLEINGAVFNSENWEGLVMPGDFSCVWAPQDIINITSTWHPMVNYPHYIYDDSLDNWGSSTHGHLTNLIDFYVITTDNSGNPTLSIKRLGDGGIIATIQPLEWGWGYIGCPILENVVKYWQYGVSDNILFALADVDQSWMRNELTNRYTEIGNIDYLDGRSYTPEVEGLMMYDAVLTYPNYAYQDEVAMGDTLAAYVDVGGNVVTTTFCWYAMGNDLGGAIMTPNYNPFNSPSGNNHFNWAYLGWNNGVHYMMNGVSSISGYYRDYLQVNPGADTVAKYDDGEYLLGYKTNPSGGVVVGLNILIMDSLVGAWQGDMVRLTRNVLHWTATSGVDIQDDEKFADFKILEISGSILMDNGWIRFYLNSPEKIYFKIFDVSGRTVYERNLDYATSGSKTLDFTVSNLVSGHYFLHLSSGDRGLTRKIIVVR
jgi:hypothetical protein